MKIFRYKEDILPVALIASLSALDLVVYLTAESLVILLSWFLVVLTFKSCICAWNHHHQHVHTFHSTFLNRALELLYALHTGITTNAWVLHHNLGHHLNYLDQSKDESGWKRRDGEVMGVAEYTVTIAVTGYLRALKVGFRHPKFLRSFLTAGLLVTLLVSVLVYLRPLQGFFVYLLPMITGYVITCWHTYYHHAGLDTDDHHLASFNIMHRWYNRLTGNLGYHTAHHMKQGLHWSKLPEYHKQIEGKIPAHLYRAPCIPFKWFPG